MNIVEVSGRLTDDPKVSYKAETQKAMAIFTMALNRGKNKDGEDLGADFPRVIAFGKKAETIEKYVHKGDQLIVQGHIHTGSYENADGDTVYTTDVIVDRMDFGAKAQGKPQAKPESKPADDFEAIDEEVPF